MGNGVLPAVEKIKNTNLQASSHIYPLLLVQSVPGRLLVKSVLVINNTIKNLQLLLLVKVLGVPACLDGDMKLLF